MDVAVDDRWPPHLAIRTGGMLSWRAARDEHRDEPEFGVRFTPHESSKSSRLHRGRRTRHADEERYGEGTASRHGPPDVALGRDHRACRERRADRRDPGS